MKYLNNLNLVQNELQNAVLQNLAVAPASPKKGQVYFDTSANKFKCWNGTSWETADNLIEAIQLGGVALTINNKTVNIPVDTALSSTSTNPIQNKVVDAAIKALDLAKVTIGAGKTLNFIQESDGIVSVEVVDIQITESQVTNLTTDLGKKVETSVAESASSTDKLVKSSTVDSKISTAIQGLDVTEIGESGKYVQKVSETDGKIAATTKQLVKTGDDVITFAETGIYSTLSLKKLATPAEGYAAQYQLQGVGGKALGDTINIYKDQFLKTAQIGHVYDTVNTSTGVITSGTGDAALDLVFSVFNPETSTYVYSIVTINIESFLTESEFGDGLQVNNHKVSVKKDTFSESFLSVSSNGIKVSGIQNAIDAKSFAATITGNGTTKDFTVTHNLNTRDVVVNIYEGAEPYQQIFTDVYMTTVNTVTVKFASAPANAVTYRVVVLK